MACLKRICKLQELKKVDSSWTLMLRSWNQKPKPIIALPINANKPRFKLLVIGKPPLPIRPHQNPSKTRTGTCVTSPRLIASKSKPNEKPEKTPAIGPSSNAKGNNQSTSQDGPTPIKEIKTGSNKLNTGTAIAVAKTMILNLYLPIKTFELAPNQLPQVLLTVVLMHSEQVKPDYLLTE